MNKLDKPLLADIFHPIVARATSLLEKDFGITINGVEEVAPCTHLDSPIYASLGLVGEYAIGVEIECEVMLMREVVSRFYGQWLDDVEEETLGEVLNIIVGNAIQSLPKALHLYTLTPPTYAPHSIKSQDEVMCSKINSPLGICAVFVTISKP